MKIGRRKGIGSIVFRLIFQDTEGINKHLLFICVRVVHYFFFLNKSGMKDSIVGEKFTFFYDETSHLYLRLKVPIFHFGQDFLFLY